MDEREGQESELPAGEHPADKTDKTDKSLNRVAWAFHEIPEDELEIALRWELEVETGSGQAHWLELPESKTAELLKLQELCNAGAKPIREIQIGRGEGDYFQLHDGAHAQTPLQLHAVEVNWEASPTAIKEALAEWVDSRPTWKAKRKRRQEKPGPKEPYSCFVDLAILRAKHNGFTQKECEILLWELCVATRKEDRVGSASSCSKASRRASGIIAELKAERQDFIDRTRDEINGLEKRVRALRSEPGIRAMKAAWDGQGIDDMQRRIDSLRKTVDDFEQNRPTTYPLASLIPVGWSRLS